MQRLEIIYTEIERLGYMECILMSTYDQWDTCIDRYSTLVQRDQWNDLAAAMLLLIARIRSDPNFPQTTQMVSHSWLRIGPPSDDPNHRPPIWVGWRKPNYYWFGVGSFGTSRRVTVSADKAVPMLKRYLANLGQIDPDFVTTYGSSEELSADNWSEESLSAAFDALDEADVLSTVNAKINHQVDDIREQVEKLHEIVTDFEHIEAANQTLDQILSRLQRIDTILDVGMQRFDDTPDVELESRDVSDECDEETNNIVDDRSNGIPRPEDMLEHD